MKYFITVLLFSSVLFAEGFINWQPPVVKATKGAKQEHGGHGGRKAKQFQINNFDPLAYTSVFYFLPTLEKRELNLENSRISIPRTGMENYHALVATQIAQNSIDSTVRYIYSRGRPSKVSPTKITQFEKTRLEIEPILLPKEHSQYEGSNTYRFKLRFDGKPLAYHQGITFTTSNGTKKTLESDEGGKFYITMPNDFKNVKTGKRANRPAELVLSASHFEKDITHTTSLAMPYYVNPLDYWFTQFFAVGLVIFGIALGIYLLRNLTKKKKKKKKV